MIKKGIAHVQKSLFNTNLFSTEFSFVLFNREFETISPEFNDANELENFLIRFDAVLKNVKK